ncbi:MAG: histidinol-phosphate transaminase [Oscillospiraceae bacterium]
MKKLVHGGDIYSYNGKNILDFSQNSNPLGLPDGVKKAIIENIENYSHYPDPLCRELKTQLASYLCVPSEFLVCGNGAADLIFRTILAIKPKKALLIVPTFSEYQSALQLCECEITYHFLLDENKFVLKEDFPNQLTSDLDVVFLCNPNNPTGIAIKSDLMICIAQKCCALNIILIVDECFNCFLEQPQWYSLMPYLQSIPNTIILKAFTKLYAMAGIRLGYAVCSDTALTEKISNTLQPWSVSTVASKCGIAALKETQYVLQTKEMITKNRTDLKQELEYLGLLVYESMANYLFFKSNHLDLAQRLEKKDILIRDCANYVGLTKGYYRIAVKTQQENSRLIACLQQILED